MKRYRLFILALLALLILAWIILHLSSTRESASKGAAGVADRAGRVFKPDTSPPRFSPE